MAKVSLSDHMQEKHDETGDEPDSSGPFVTISRQYGCWGFSLGLLLLEILNDNVDPDTVWKIYHKEILDRLASDTNTATDILDNQRRSKPKLLAEFFRSLGKGKKDRLPSGFEIRRKITSVIRALASEGHAIFVGQGSAGATQDLPNGISVRLEAPLEWRVKQIAFREGLSEIEAKLQIQSKEQERSYLRKIYEAKFPRKPAFNVMYDCSVFSLTQIAQSVANLMKMKNCL